MMVVYRRSDRQVEKKVQKEITLLCLASFRFVILFYCLMFGVETFFPLFSLLLLPTSPNGTPPLAALQSYNDDRITKNKIILMKKTISINQFTTSSFLFLCYESTLLQLSFFFLRFRPFSSFSFSLRTDSHTFTTVSRLSRFLSLALLIEALPHTHTHTKSNTCIHVFRFPFFLLLPLHFYPHPHASVSSLILNGVGVVCFSLSLSLSSSSSSFW